MEDIVIVGSGMAGMAAALELSENGLQPLMLDVGFEPTPAPPINENIYDYCEKYDSNDLILGASYEGLHNLRRTSKYIPPRLVAPRFQYVTHRATELLPTEEDNFSSVQSLAKGGLGNAWGAGSFRFTQRDMVGFPISASELTPFYDKLSKEMGISGTKDDLSPYFGDDQELQPPLNLSPNARKILEVYEKKRKHFNSKGVFLGRPRYAILTKEKNGRQPFEYNNLEFWQPHIPAIYNPSFTIDRLIRERRLRYRSNLLVESWRTHGDTIVVSSTDTSSGKKVETQCRRLLLAAGAINSTRIVLQSFQDYETKLPLLDNPAIQIPIVLPWRIGTKLNKNDFGLAHLSMVIDTPEFSTPLQGTLLDLTSPAKGEFYGRFPLSASANITCIKYLLPAMMVNLLFFPSDAIGHGTLRLSVDGKLVVQGSSTVIPQSYLYTMTRYLRTLGAVTHPALMVRVPGGGGIHYAGCLPMMKYPNSRYATNQQGELAGQKNVFVLDAATFPRLPAKNHTLSLAANAMRIARHVARI